MPSTCTQAVDFGAGPSLGGAAPPSCRLSRGSREPSCALFELLPAAPRLCIARGRLPRHHRVACRPPQAMFSNLARASRPPSWRRSDEGSGEHRAVCGLRARGRHALPRSFERTGLGFAVADGTMDQVRVVECSAEFVPACSWVSTFGGSSGRGDAHVALPPGVENSARAQHAVFVLGDLG